MTTQGTEPQTAAPHAKPADTSVPLHPLLAQRWSPRSFDATADITEAQLTALFEAARWAPSWGNTQPASYLVGHRGEPTHERILETLNRGNRSWAEPAAALLIGVTRVSNEAGEPLPYGAYGLALATQNLVLQAEATGLVAHQMAGFDHDAARAAFTIPEDHEPLVAIAVGAQAAPDALDGKLREKELAPRSRKELAELVFSRSWGTPRW